MKQMSSIAIRVDFVVLIWSLMPGQCRPIYCFGTCNGPFGSRLPGLLPTMMSASFAEPSGVLLVLNETLFSVNPN